MGDINEYIIIIKPSSFLANLDLIEIITDKHGTMVLSRTACAEFLVANFSPL